MANSADIIVNVVAKTGKFTSGMARSSKALRQFQGTARTVIKGLQKLAGVAAAAGAAAAPFIALAQAGLQSADALAKTSQKLGLTADALSALRLAAEQTGVASNQLDLGLQRMTRRIAEAAAGSGEAKGALQELGLSAKALAQLSPEKQFEELAKAFEAVGSQSDKVRLGFKLFDSEGVALINTLDLGAAGLREVAEEAERLGLSLKPQQLRIIQDAVDAQGRLKLAVTGLSQQLGSTLAPVFKRVTDATTSFVATITNSLPTWASWAAAVLGVKRNLEDLTVVQLQAEAAEINKQFLEAAGAVNLEREALRNLNAENRKLTNDQLDQLPIMQTLIAKRDALNKRYNDTIAAIRAARIEERGMPAAMADSEIAVIQLADTTGLLEDAWTRINKAVEQHQARLAALGQSITLQVEKPTERFVRLMGEAREALDKGAISDETFRRYRELLLSDVVPAIDDVNKKTNDLQMTFESAFENAIVQGMKFRDVLDGVLQDLLRITLRKTITEPLGNFFAGLFTRHIGGSVSAGVPYQTIPGEVFVPQTAGKIYPASRAPGGGATFNLQWNIDARGADEASVMSRIVPALEQTRRATIAEMRLLVREGRFV